MKKLILVTCVLTFGLFACKQTNNEWKNKVADAELFHLCENQLTKVVVFDIFSPPVAARVYVYPNIAAYEAMVPSNSGLTSLAGKLNGLEAVPQPESGKEYSYEIAATTALIETSKAFIFSEDKMNSFRDSLYNFYKTAKVPEDVLKNSIEYGNSVADHIKAWAAKDNYKESRSFERYTPLKADSAYVPTPPDYADALEPHWGEIRCMIMDSASEFMPVRPFAFNMKDKNSEFYKQVMEVYETINNTTEEQTHIAKFWDNNPYVNEHHGHLMVGVKKVSPPGHWLGIAGMACHTKNTDFAQSVEAYTFTSIAFFEAFISAFDEKYRSHYIRPETVINTYIDDKWKPIIQTPPFPEYTSAHSVTSGAAATILTQLFGDNFAFTDSVEVPFGQQPRQLPSFLAAAQEASMSRLYGGIHYLASLNNGNLQGRLLGKHIVDELGIKPFEFSEAEKHEN